MPARGSGTGSAPSGSCRCTRRVTKGGRAEHIAVAPLYARWMTRLHSRVHALPLLLLAFLSFVSPAFAQSQAANGSIEGTVTDPSGGVLPGVVVTVTSTDTGAVRSVVTNESGLYRAPLLPLGG